jgi:hypothetical protein
MDTPEPPKQKVLPMPDPKAQDKKNKKDLAMKAQQSGRLSTLLSSSDTLG